MTIVVFDHLSPNFNDYISNHMMTNKRSYYTNKEIDIKMHTSTIICVVDSCSLYASDNSLLLLEHSVVAGH